MGECQHPEAQMLRPMCSPSAEHCSQSLQMATQGIASGGGRGSKSGAQIWPRKSWEGGHKLRGKEDLSPRQDQSIRPFPLHITQWGQYGNGEGGGLANGQIITDEGTWQNYYCFRFQLPDSSAHHLACIYSGMDGAHAVKLWTKCFGNSRSNRKLANGNIPGDDGEVGRKLRLCLKELRIQGTVAFCRWSGTRAVQRVGRHSGNWPGPGAGTNGR